MRTTFILAIALLAFPGCDDDEVGGHETGDTDSVVGDPCSTDGDCAARCYTDPEDFPGGFCSLPCATDADCPSDTACVDKSNGVCLFTCPAFDCGFLGAGWRCDDKDHRTGGTVFVCTGD